MNRQPPADRRSPAPSAPARAAARQNLADRRRRHAFVGVVDMRIGDVLVGSEEAGIFAAEIERLFQIRHHGGEVVRRPRPRPGVVGGRAVRVRARDVVGRDLDRLLVVAARDADEAGVVGIVRQAFAERRKRVEQPADRWARPPARARGGTASRSGGRARRRRPPACRSPGPSRARRPPYAGR